MERSPLTSALSALTQSLGPGLRSLVESLSGRSNPAPALAGFPAHDPAADGGLGALDVAFAKGRPSVNSPAARADALRSRVESRLRPAVSAKLEELGAWRAIDEALTAAGAERKTAARFFEQLSNLRPALIRAIHEQGGWHDLARVFARGQNPEHAYFEKGGVEITIKMLDAVQRTRADRSRVGELLEIMARYDGDPSILKSFLFKLCEAKGRASNPFEPCRRRAQVRYPALSDVPDELKVPSVDGQGRTIYRVKAEGGHLLTTAEIYLIEDLKEPALPFISGHQAATKIFAAFAAERVSEVSEPRRALEKNGEMLADALRGLFEDRTRQLGDGREAVQPVRRSLEPLEQVIDRLQSYIRSLRGDAHRLTAGEQLLDFHSANSLVEAAEAGTLLTRLNRRAARGDLPEEVQIALTAYQDARLKRTPEVQARLARTIAAYAFLSEPVEKKAHLAPLLTDVRAYSEFREQRGEAGLSALGVPAVDVEDARGRVSKILDQGGPEMTLAELAAVKAAFGFADAFRRAVNTAELRRYGTALGEAAELFRPLFMEERKLLPDALKPEVPMGRLSGHLYGMRIFKRASDHAQSSLLTREEFGAIKEFIRLGVIHPDEARFVAAMNVADFREMTSRLIVAARKVEDLRRVLAGSGESLDTFDPATDGARLAQLGLTVLGGPGYRPAELFAEEHELTLGEVRKRAESKGPLKLAPTLARTWNAGLWAPGAEMTTAYEWALKLVPVADLEPQSTRAQQFEFAKRVRALYPIVDPNADLAFTGGEYLLPKEIKTLERLWRFKPAFDAAGLADAAAADALRAEGERLAKERVLEGSCHPRSGYIKFASTHGYLPHGLFTAAGDGVNYVKPEALRAESERRAREFVRPGELPDGWWDTFRSVVEARGRRDVLSEFNMLRSREELLVERNFVEQVAARAEALRSPRIDAAARDRIGPSDKLVWVNGEPTINFGRQYPGRSLIDVAVNDPSYIDFLARNTWSKVPDRASHEHINVICRRILEEHLPRPGERRSSSRADFRDIEGFKRWLRAEFKSA